MTRVLISIDELRKLVRYEAKAGKLFWLPRPASMFSREWHARVWNTKWAGREAFLNPRADKATKTLLLGEKYYASEIAWALYTGQWPTGKVYHVNGDVSDNRIGNLRDVPKGMRRDTAARQIASRSGHVGVYWLRDKEKWAAYIYQDGKPKRLGCFKYFGDAVDARKAAEATKAEREAERKAAVIADGMPTRCKK